MRGVARHVVGEIDSLVVVSTKTMRVEVTSTPKHEDGIEETKTPSTQINIPSKRFDTKYKLKCNTDAIPCHGHRIWQCLQSSERHSSVQQIGNSNTKSRTIV